MARSQRTRKPRRRVGGKRVARKRSPTMATRQMATISETVEYKDINVNTSLNLSFNLAQFSRASALAPNFKWYKAAKVEWQLEPVFNVYQEGVALETVPYLYYRMNRTQDAIACTKSDLQAMGAKPQKFTSKKVISFVPNWCSPGLTTYSKNPVDGNMTGLIQQGLKPQYSYLASPGTVSDPYLASTFLTPIDGRDSSVVPLNSGMNSVGTNSVRYNGADLFFDQLFQSGTSVVSRLTCTVTWIFKDPNFNTLVAAPPVEPKEV